MTGRPDVVESLVGRADVLHRLALGVECLDATTRGRVRTDVAVGRELPGRLLPVDHVPHWPCITLESQGTGRARLRFDRTTPRTTPVRLRIADPGLRFVPRRLDVRVWQLSEILAADDAGSPVRAASRVLRPWLWPGSAALLPGGTTAIRGTVRVPGTGSPVRWARLTAVRHKPGGGPPDIVGRGHADERGEFVVVVRSAGALPPPFPRVLQVDLRVVAPPDPAPPDPHPQDPQSIRPDPLDRYGDLVVEDLAHASDPPLPAELDNAVLRGTATPPGYLTNTAAVPTLDVVVGAELLLATAIPFAP